MTLADMILAHELIDRIGIETAVAILKASDGDAPLGPDMYACADRAATLLEQELGEHETATQEVRAAEAALELIEQVMVVMREAIATNLPST